jgi:uncharacterized protein (TIGR02246 family)
MIALSPAISYAARTHTERRIRLTHSRVVFSGAALALGLLVGGCDSPTPIAPTAPNAAVSDALDNVGPQHGDEAGVAAVAAAWDAAWNAGDSRAIAALFTDDAEFINGRGQIAVGPAAIYAQHAANLAGPFKGSHIEGQIRRITFLSGTAAVLDVDSQLTGFVSLPAGTVPTEPGVQRGRHKRVVVKRGGVWKMALMQITLIAPTR